MKKLMKVAVFQMKSCGDIEVNKESIRKAAIEASNNNANLLCLPENCHSFTTDKEVTQSNLEYLNGPSISFYREVAKSCSLAISIGGFPQRISDSTKKFHNTHILVNCEGEISGVYKKIHLFDINIDENNKFLESQSIEAGNEIVVVDEIGLSICYDLRFPELYRKLSENGAKILLVPAAFLQKTGEAHWEILLRARAIENQCFVIAAAQAGNLEGKRDSYGHSMVIDPWGNIILDMKDEIGLGYADLDFSFLEDIRERLPCLNHKRRDMFTF